MKKNILCLLFAALMMTTTSAVFADSGITEQEEVTNAIEESDYYVAYLDDGRQISLRKDIPNRTQEDLEQIVANINAGIYKLEDNRIIMSEGQDADSIEDSKMPRWWFDEIRVRNPHGCSYTGPYREFLSGASGIKLDPITLEEVGTWQTILCRDCYYEADGILYY